MTLVKKLATFTAVSMLAAWAAGPALAANQEAAKSKPNETRKAEYTSLQVVSGTVSGVELDAKTLDIKVPGKKADSLVVGALVTDRTVIREGGRPRRA